jgi:hypothetical protein
MMMAFYLLVTCIVLQVLFSLVFPVQHTEESRKLYWSSPLKPLIPKNCSSRPSSSPRTNSGNESRVQGNGALALEASETEINTPALSV